MVNTFFAISTYSIDSERLGFYWAEIVLTMLTRVKKIWHAS
jgi:hypothetical protein